MPPTATAATTKVIKVCSCISTDLRALRSSCLPRPPRENIEGYDIYGYDIYGYRELDIYGYKGLPRARKEAT